MTAEQSERIEQLYLEMYAMLLTYANCLLGEGMLAEEAVQETFRIACQKPDNLINSQNPKGWLVNTLKYTIRNMKRSRESARQLMAKYLVANADKMTIVEDQINFEIMYENVADTEEFKLVKEMAIDGLSHLQMANARGISVDACKKRVQRAKETLKKKL